MRRLLANARIIDATGDVLSDRFVVIEDRRIADIGPMPGFPATPAGEVVDVSGLTVMPGMIDCHVHLSIDGDADPIAQVVGDTAAMSVLRMARNAERTIAAGVTTVRDLGARDHVDISFRRALAEGLQIAAPRLVLSGQPVTMTGGHCWQFGRQADGVDDARRAAREQIRAGADCVKLMATGGILTQGNEIGAAQLEEAEMRAAIEEADKAGKLSAVHAHGASGIKNGIRAGVQSVEHAYFLDDEGIGMMLDCGVWLVPTAAAVDLVVKNGIESGIPPDVVEKAESAVESQRATCARALRSGVRIAMGTDAGTPYNRHGENAQELAALVSLGMTPMDAIRATTIRGAELLGLSDRLGTVQVGKTADILVVDGDPLADISVLRRPERIAMVLQDGEIVARRGEIVAPGS
ncbi:MAG: amidohydrolase family protein [Defluviicoccus sp.]|nr:amidohydrolase family protein [Defluviicoccus sp.]MDE0387021.1 amidohydrolase family protein [Defluviicoccus sp.]